jgi:hypothetical protein
MIDRSEADTAIATMLRSGAQGIPVDAFDAIAAARASGWCLTEELLAFLIDSRRWNNDLEANLRRWHAFLRVASLEATSRQFQAWAFRVVDAMLLTLPKNDPEHILAVAAAGAMLEPVDEAEASYRRRLLEAFDFVRFQYGIKKSVGRLLTERQIEAEREAAASATADSRVLAEIDEQSNADDPSV